MLNERTKQLAEQAGFQYINEEGIGWAGNHNASLPKFAELIVRECIAQLEVGKRCDPYTGECEVNLLREQALKEVDT